MSSASTIELDRDVSSADFRGAMRHLVFGREMM
jgi:hypothetical protein